jgi:hypothetical protein
VLAVPTRFTGGDKMSSMSEGPLFQRNFGLKMGFAPIWYEIDRFSRSQSDIKLVWTDPHGKPLLATCTWIRADFTAAPALAVAFYKDHLSGPELILEYARYGQSISKEIIQAQPWAGRLHDVTSTWRPIPDAPTAKFADNLEETGEYAPVAVFLTSNVGKEIVEEFIKANSNDDIDYFTIITSTDIRSNHVMHSTEALEVTPNEFIGWSAEKIYSFVKSNLHQPYFQDQYCVILDEKTVTHKTSLFMEVTPWEYSQETLEGLEDDVDIGHPGRITPFVLVRTGFSMAGSIFANCSIANMDWKEFYDWGQDVGGFRLSANDDD